MQLAAAATTVARRMSVGYCMKATRKERCAASAAVHSYVEREGDHGYRQMPMTQVMGVTNKEIRDALDALLYGIVGLRVLILRE
eukprot:5004469-Pleurochrysis_carterae.AAC.12